ncbi:MULTISPECIES: hypothetical protein [unclassified Roseateles]|uniref:hypothetical protein n=1 Tax=unclassified Roseateles TaxID=2626991 RepID=UPI0006FC83D4|nr:MULTISPECIES: hypothetical protein [unclassified Roseateles]KQW46382.1 hypothetical protein ASC81_08205 [Pelomonas sp. Root405]KRA73432.1 hypothetical protein ASD88_08205 [Pelomonas sp. Root662]
MTRTTFFSLCLAAVGMALFGWLGYDASHVAATLGLNQSLGEAGVALAGLAVSAGLVIAAARLSLRQRVVS